MLFSKSILVCALFTAANLVSAQSTLSASNTTISANATVLAQGTTVAPTGGLITLTSTYWDDVCTCTKTKAISISAAAISGFATSVPIQTATGSPITSSAVYVTPSATVQAQGSTVATFTGIANRADVGSFAAAAIAVAGIAVAL